VKTEHTEGRFTPPQEVVTGSDGIVVRRVESSVEYEECVRIQSETWGAGFNESVPGTILRVTQYLGGVTAAAFSPQGGRMLGFVFGMTGVQQGRLVHWSDLLAVRQEARDRGIGRRLKVYQRSQVLRLGVTRMLWTFDPLVARNAHLNLNALGASVSAYVPDMYGSDTGSTLHRSVGTDRFIVEWNLTAERAETPQSPGPAIAPPASLVVNPEETAPVQTNDALHEVYIAVPDDLQDLIATAPERAALWRQTTRKAFLWYLENGYQVCGFVRADGRGYYQLNRSKQ
jgi:predicted GNAT superfamily acetyltransferase